MTRDSWILGLAGVAFGILIGWIIGSQSARSSSPPASATQQQAASGPQGQQGPGQGQAGQPGQPGQGNAGGAPSGVQAPPPFDEAQAKSLADRAASRPKDAEVRSQLGNLYFDAERYSDAVKWYEAALTLAPKNANVSTDLAVSYYYTNQLDRALKQFETSLAIDPRHTKTLLNLGMVKAFGRQDLLGAAQAWKQVIDIAPADSPEARAARQALESLRAAHPDPSGGDGKPGGGKAGQPAPQAQPGQPTPKGGA
jgi:predicted TPR repeat methyltransferase